MIYLFPLASIALNLGASVVYFVKHDPGHGAYWLLAAGITAVATWGLR